MVYIFALNCMLIRIILVCLCGVSQNCQEDQDMQTQTSTQSQSTTSNYRQICVVPHLK